MQWQNLRQVPSLKYTCGYCGNGVASADGYQANHPGTNTPEGYIRVCPHCAGASYFSRNGGRQIPGNSIGNKVDALPVDIEALYNEARSAASVSAYTACVLACRKLLMNIAVEQGAKEGDNFLAYVEYLAAKGYVPPNGKHWVDHIRKKGNEATHEIKMMSSADAAELVSFTEMLLKFIYEFPSKVPMPSTP